MNNSDEITRQEDLEFNRREFEKHGVQCLEFPKIDGRILIAKFAVGGTIRLGRNVTINSNLESNPMGGVQTVFVIKGPQAVIEIGNDVGMSNAMNQDT